MIKNASSLKDNARNVAEKNDISIGQVLQNYMFERVLERLSKSKYKENFVIKGGLLLSSIMGINLRTTMDIDTNIVGISLEKENLLKILEQILSLDIVAFLQLLFLDYRIKYLSIHYQIAFYTDILFLSE